MSSLKLTYRSIANLHLTDKTKATQTKKEEKIPLEETVYTKGWSSISQIDHFPKFSYETSRVVKQWWEGVLLAEGRGDLKKFGRRGMWRGGEAIRRYKPRGTCDCNQASLSPPPIPCNRWGKLNSNSCPPLLIPQLLPQIWMIGSLFPSITSSDMNPTSPHRFLSCRLHRCGLPVDYHRCRCVQL